MKVGGNPNQLKITEAYKSDEKPSNQTNSVIHSELTSNNTIISRIISVENVESSNESNEDVSTESMMIVNVINRPQTKTSKNTKTVNKN